jgi:uncharacterized damage-inducible protein DinB
MTETVTDLVSRLERAHSAFCESLVELGETDRLDERPGEAAWNAREVTAHQINTERWLRGFAERDAGRATEDEPHLPEREAGAMTDFEAAPLPQLVRLLEAERELTLTLLAHKTDADLGRLCGTAPWGEALTLGRCLNVLAGHQSRHTAQLTAILRSTPAA